MVSVGLEARNDGIAVAAKHFLEDTVAVNTVTFVADMDELRLCAAGIHIENQLVETALASDDFRQVKVAGRGAGDEVTGLAHHVLRVRHSAHSGVSQLAAVTAADVHRGAENLAGRIKHVVDEGFNVHLH